MGLMEGYLTSEHLQEEAEKPQNVQEASYAVRMLVDLTLLELGGKLGNAEAGCCLQEGSTCLEATPSRTCVERTRNVHASELT